MLLVKRDSVWLWHGEPLVGLPDALYRNRSSTVMAGDLRISLGHRGTAGLWLEPVQCLIVFDITGASWCRNWRDVNSLCEVCVSAARSLVKAGLRHWSHTSLWREFLLWRENDLSSCCLPGQASASWLSPELWWNYFWFRLRRLCTCLPCWLFSSRISLQALQIHLHLQAFTYAPADCGSLSSSAVAEVMSVQQVKNWPLCGHLSTKNFSHPFSPSVFHRSVWLLIEQSSSSALGLASFPCFVFPCLESLVPNGTGRGFTLWYKQACVRFARRQSACPVPARTIWHLYWATGTNQTEMKNVSRLSRVSTSTAKEATEMALNKEQSDSYLSVLDGVVWWVFSSFKVFNGASENGLIKPVHTNGATKCRIGTMYT